MQQFNVLFPWICLSHTNVYDYNNLLNNFGVPNALVFQKGVRFNVPNYCHTGIIKKLKVTYEVSIEHLQFLYQYMSAYFLQNSEFEKC